VAAFGIEGMKFLAVPEQPGFAQPRAGSDDGGISMLTVFGHVHFNEVGGLKSGQPVGDGLQVVEKENFFHACFFPQFLGVDYPVKVGHLHFSFLHRPGDGKTQPVGFRGSHAKVEYHIRKGSPVLRFINVFTDDGKLAVFYFKKRHVGFGTAGVGSQNREVFLGIFLVGKSNGDEK
jgi:hypothetical protein